jgi:branched-chain amino acid transport system substrate-binding protein
MCSFKKIGANKGETPMSLKHLALGLTIAAAMPAMFAKAHAEEGLYVPFFTYRTGPFAGSGIPYANGLADYLNMLNERDGGIGGVKLIVEECETGYDTKKGVECYDSVKGKNPVVITPLSTGVTLQVIPKAVVDKMPVLSVSASLLPGNLRRNLIAPETSIN